MPEIRSITCHQKPRNIPKVKTKKKQGLTTPNFKWKMDHFNLKFMNLIQLKEA